jgi:hypothetical protein
MTEVKNNAQKSCECLPLINRYHAAWIEHGTRITQRQNVVQIYLATIGLIFGFYFNIVSADTKSGVGVNEFLLLSVMFMSASHAALIWVHNRVIQNLCRFMMRCEFHCREEISGQGESADDLFYFLDARAGRQQVHEFHSSQRFLHRLIVALVFGAVQLAAIVITWEKVDLGWSIFGIVLLPVSAFALYSKRHLDIGAA